MIASTTPAAWLSGIAAPLSAKFGGHLTVSRTGNVVCWGYDGQSAAVELAQNGTMRVTFMDSERRDFATGRPAAAVYRTRAAYALNQPSCTRMIADLVDFFSGVREPQFTFVDAYSR